MLGRNERPLALSTEISGSKASLNARREATSVGDKIEILKLRSGSCECLTSKSNPLASASMKDLTEHTALTCVEDQMDEGVTKATTSGRCVASRDAALANPLSMSSIADAGVQETRMVKTSTWASAAGSKLVCATDAAENLQR